MVCLFIIYSVWGTLDLEPILGTLCEAGIRPEWNGSWNVSGHPVHTLITRVGEILSSYFNM